MIIDKSFSKTELIEIITELDLRVINSHRDNKKELQKKLIEFIENEEYEIDLNNSFNIKTKESLIYFLTNKNPKKTLSIKEKNNVMEISKNIINYCKCGHILELSKYDSFKDLCDDLDFVKQFGDIPSVRRACRLMNLDNNIYTNKFTPLVSPHIQKIIDDKKIMKSKHAPFITIKYSTLEDPIIVRFD